MIKVKFIFVSLISLLGFLLTGLATAATHNTKNLSAPVYHAPLNTRTNTVMIPEEHLHKTANLSYKVAGKRYFPLQKVTKYSEVGRASFYGGHFHGRRTSSGELFNQYTLTAAHPTLPIPSYARVTNLNNGKSIVVRINDRGPFHAKRIIDVSRAAAEKLDFVRAGTAQVRVEQILPGTQLVAQNIVLPDNRYVDLQQFHNKQTAQQYLSSTQQHLKEAHSIQNASLVKVNNHYVVRMGPFEPQTNNEETMKKVMQTTTL